MPDTNQNAYVVTCAGGVENLLLEEIQALGALQCEVVHGAVHCVANLETAYRICLWSRLASRVLRTVSHFSAEDSDDLYEKASMLPWSEHIEADGTLAVHCAVGPDEKENSHYLALKLKDAIVDRFNRNQKQRPTIQKTRPDVMVFLFRAKGQATISIDFSGAPLHLRGYRTEAGAAPLKETLAAAVVAAVDVLDPEVGQVIDPMCGSGTLLVEAAMVIGDIAPGLARDYFGFRRWKQHDEDIWQGLIEEAEARKEAGAEKKWPLLRGYDADRDVIKAANNNIQRAGLSWKIHIERRELAQFSIPKNEGSTGLILCNPPYGERLGHGDQLLHLYRCMGRAFSAHCEGWNSAIISNDIELLDAMGLKQLDTLRLYNGPLRCYLRLSTATGVKVLPPIQHALSIRDVPVEGEGADFSNRLKKNFRKLGKWIKKEGVSCYRLYDADMPEFNVAVDWYDGYFHVQEYKAPKTVDEKKAAHRLTVAVDVLSATFGVNKRYVFVKTRAKQKGKSQYEKLNSSTRLNEVAEHGPRMLLNFHDYLDTGLFLDHRPIRLWIQQNAKGKRFLNLYAYTGTASVQAAWGGAKATTTVDMSNTYADWSRSNMLLNGFSEEVHKIERADCKIWLMKNMDQFDLIFMDPPTFSNSKKMGKHMDIQEDHVLLIDLAMKRLEHGGTLVFSNNYRKFELDAKIPEQYVVEEITKQSIGLDFDKGKPIHRCWLIKHPEKVEKKAFSW